MQTASMIVLRGYGYQTPKLTIIARSYGSTALAKRGDRTGQWPGHGLFGELRDKLTSSEKDG